jgi:hypothetical protein
MSQPWRKTDDRGSDEAHAEARMTLKLSHRTWLVVPCALLAVAAAVVLDYCFWTAHQSEDPDPNPNGFNDLVAAGQMIRGTNLDVRHATEETLRQFAATNSAALERARLGLTRQCRVPAIYLAGSLTNVSRHMKDWEAIKRAARSFAAEGRWAELEGKPMEAAASYLRSVTVGIQLSHGGVFLDQMVAVGCESVGFDGLDTIVPKLDAAQSRQVERQLEELAARLEPKSEIERHEAMLGRKLIGSPEYFFYTIGRPIVPQWRKPWQMVAAQYDRQHHRLLAEEIDLAAHACELEHGRKAQGWGDLVPAYLKAIPQDPLTGGDFNMTEKPTTRTLTNAWP